jgi:hypothetical protein
LICQAGVIGTAALRHALGHEVVEGGVVHTTAFGKMWMRHSRRLGVRDRRSSRVRRCPPLVASSPIASNCWRGGCAKGGRGFHTHIARHPGLAGPTATQERYHRILKSVGLPPAPNVMQDAA